jgi:hypothetical protein
MIVVQMYSRPNALIDGTCTRKPAAERNNRALRKKQRGKKKPKK